MASTQAICTSFLKELGQALHDFTTTTGHTFKIALYSSTAALSSATTVYSSTNEVSGTGYVAGGTTIASVTPTSSGTTVIFDFADASWAGSTITARYALIYNSTATNRAVCVLDFGSDKTSSASTFTVTMPAATADSAIIRLSSS
jgi:hypothetical protein